VGVWVHVLSGAPSLAATDGALYDCRRQHAITPWDVVHVVDPGAGIGAAPAGITEVLVESHSGPGPAPAVGMWQATAVDPDTGRHTFTLPEGVCVVRVRSVVEHRTSAASERYTFVMAPTGASGGDRVIRPCGSGGC
jgi:hypothetical protein